MSTLTVELIAYAFLAVLGAGIAVAFWLVIDSIIRLWRYSRQLRQDRTEEAKNKWPF